MIYRDRTASRRHFLVGAGVTMGLPLLESFARPKRASAQGDDKPIHAAFMVATSGVQQQRGSEPERFWPRQTGPLTSASLRGQNSDRATSELADHADRLSLVKGINFAYKGNGCAHSGGGNQVLTAHRVSDNPSKNKSLAMGESIDHRIARAVNPEGRGPFNLYAGQKSSFMADHMSFRGPKDLIVGQGNPFLAYTKMMGMTGRGGAGQRAAELVATRRQSVNDLIRADMQSLLAHKDLSTDDKRRLDMHLESIRDIEIRLTAQLPQETVDAMEVIRDPRENGNRLEVVRLHSDLMVFAFSSGYTRVSFLQNGDGSDKMTYTVQGATTPVYHQISHRIYSDGSSGPPIKDADRLHHEIDRIHMRQFAYLLDRMAETKTPEGDLLDTSFAVWTNQLATGSHQMNDVPYLVAGRARGFLRTGQYINAGGVMNNRILNTFANAAGVRTAGGGMVNDMGDASLPKGMVGGLVA